MESEAGKTEESGEVGAAGAVATEDGEATGAEKVESKAGKMEESEGSLEKNFKSGLPYS